MRVLPICKENSYCQRRRHRRGKRIKEREERNKLKKKEIDERKKENFFKMTDGQRKNKMGK